MLLRKKIWPRTLDDLIITSFLFIIIPIVYYFELFIVLPTFYPTWTVRALFHYILGNFIMFNVCSNLVAIILCDTSIKGRILSSSLEPEWRFCSACESVAPPRSWHCNICNICILKRDHHCVFTSCCLGHFNQRYFLIFTFYIFIASLYATYYNFYFILEFIEIWSLKGIAKVVFPLAFLFVDPSDKQFYLFLVLIIFYGNMFTGLLLFYHLDMMVKGMITHERNNKKREYDYGKKRNIINVFGTRWYLVWLSPFIESPLPHDGIHWESVKTK